MRLQVADRSQAQAQREDDRRSIRASRAPRRSPICFCQIRAGTDIAFLGGLINYAIENNRIAQRLPRQLHERRVHRQGRLQAAGRRTACSPASTRQKQSYDKIDLELRRQTAAGHARRRAASRRQQAAAAGTVPALPAKVAYDLTLQNPRCVFQLLKKHYSRYTPEMVERITGIPKDQFLKAADCSRPSARTAT